MNLLSPRFNRHILINHVSIHFSPRPNLIRLSSFRQMIFKSENPTPHMLYQGFHLCCATAPNDVTQPDDLEGIQDLMPQDVEMVRRWIQTGTAPPPVLSLSSQVNRPTTAFYTRMKLAKYWTIHWCVFTVTWSVMSCL